MSGIYDITPFSLLDYPGEMACIVWMAGCNMRCVYCHNPKIVCGKGTKEDKELFDFLSTRHGKLTGVVFSGGEATLHEGLEALIARTKEMGFKVKLDTNGSRPKVLRSLLEKGLLDYVAMDYKCPRENALQLVGTAKLWDPFRESLSLLIEAANSEKILLEVRTTVSTDFLTENEINWIIHDLELQKYRGTYYIQNVFSHGEKTIGGINKPERVLCLEKLRQPRGFKLGFRNFPT